MEDICFGNLTTEELETLSRNVSNELTRRKNKSKKRIGKR